jgi:DNA-directed RNA polymerase subunit RPC12/RpoP
MSLLKFINTVTKVAKDIDRQNKVKSAYARSLAGMLKIIEESTAHVRYSKKFDTRYSRIKVIITYLNRFNKTNIYNHLKYKPEFFSTYVKNVQETYDRLHAIHNNIVSYMNENIKKQGLEYCPVCNIKFEIQFTRSFKCPSCNNKIIPYKQYQIDKMYVSETQKKRIEEIINTHTDINFSSYIWDYITVDSSVISFYKGPPPFPQFR